MKYLYKKKSKNQAIGKMQIEKRSKFNMIQNG